MPKVGSTLMKLYAAFGDFVFGTLPFPFVFANFGDFADVADFVFRRGKYTSFGDGFDKLLVINNLLLF